MPTPAEIKASNIYHPNLISAENIAHFIKANALPENSIFLTPSPHELFLQVVYIHHNKIQTNLIAAFTEEPTRVHFKAFNSITDKSEDDFGIEVLIAPLEEKQKINDFKASITDLTLTPRKTPIWKFYASSEPDKKPEQPKVSSMSFLKRDQAMSNLCFVRNGKPPSP